MFHQEMDISELDIKKCRHDKCKPGEQAYLYNLNRVTNDQYPRVLCAASRTYEEKAEDSRFSFISKSPSGTWNVMRILLPSKNKKVILTDHLMRNVPEISTAWDKKSKTCLLQFENSSEGHRVEIMW